MTENTTPDKTPALPDTLEPDFLENGFELISDAVLVTEAEPLDKSGPKILWENDVFYQLTGYSPSEVLGKSPRMLQRPLTDKSALKALRTSLEKWEVAIAEVLNYKKDGSTFWNEFVATPITNEVGHFTHWISIKRDVTQRRDTQLLISNRELAIQNKEKDERAKELILANEQLAFQVNDKDKRAMKLVQANHKLAIQKNTK
jgi:PAS domain S-box-containing protein